MTDSEPLPSAIPAVGETGGLTDELPTMPPSADDPSTIAPSGDGHAGAGTLPVIPGYQILNELGRGGMGVVYRAKHIGLNRLVALKVVLNNAYATPEARQRFLDEAAILAKLQHANIVQIYDSGAHEGIPYFALELVAGGSLQQRLQGTPQLPRPAALLVETLARAVQAAHDQGIVHRDLKPANILLTNEQAMAAKDQSKKAVSAVANQASFGIPKITDFGLAKQLDLGAHLTQSGMVMGTPSYMAPEQAAGQVRAIGPAADVYALGAILYELLTGGPPFRAATPLDTILQVLESEPVPPRRLQPATPRDLETICLKCLAKEPARRYASAQALADDLRAWIEDRPITARPVGRLERGWRWCRRNPAVASLLTAITLLVIGGLTGLTLLYLRAEDQRALAEQQQLRAEVNECQAQQNEQAAKARESETKAVLDFVEQKVFAAGRPKGQEGGLGYDVMLVDAMKASLPFVAANFKDQPLIEARLRLTLGNSFFYLGDAKTAAEQYQTAHNHYAQYSGPDDPRALQSMNNLANCYHRMGRHADALQLREKAWALMKAKLGPDHADTLKSMNNVTVSYSALGRHADALRLSEEALALMNVKLGPDHPDTLHTKMRLAGSYLALGRLTEARTLTEETLALQQAKLGANHPDTLQSMSNLALCYAAAGRRADALKLNEETVALRKTKLGPDHPDTLQSMNNLAHNYAAVGRHADALKLYLEVLSLRRAKLGPDHPDTLTSMLGLANTYYVLGQLADARRVYQELFAGQERLTRLQPDNAELAVMVGGTCCNLGNICRDTAAPAEALPWYGQAIDKLAAVLDHEPKHATARLYLRNAHRGRAESLDKLARHAEAVKEWDQALDLNRDPQPQQWFRGQRAASLARAGDHAKAFAEATVLAEAPGISGDTFYDLACICALACAAVKDDAKLQDQYAARAVELLRQAIRKGYKDTEHLKTDEDLKALRERMDYRDLLRELPTP